MTSISKFIGAAVPIAFFAGAVHAETDAPSQAMFDRLMKAVQTNDYAAMTDGAMDTFKKGITPELLSSVSKDFGPHLAAGYTAIYLGDLKQHGFTTRLWKLTFKDGRDDALIRLSEQNGQVAGFFIQ